jgi:hypothetical protein
MTDFTFAHRQEGFDEHIDWSIRGYRNLQLGLWNIIMKFLQLQIILV